MKRDYDMIVIGGGAAGLTASGISASFGAKTALIEAKKLGGDCTWYGCVPSKTLLKAAKIAHHFKTADRYGLESCEAKFDFSKVIGHIHKTQEEVYRDADDPAIYEKMGIDVLSGSAGFLDNHTIEFTSNDGETSRLSSRYFIIATGSSAVVPPIEGLPDVEYLTNETVFSVDRLPQKMIVVGGGPIGVEMSQAFRRFGAEVTVIDMADGILVRDDRELAGIIKERLSEEGVEFILNSSVKKFEGNNTTIRVAVENGSSEAITVEGDALLIAAGRKANTANLNLEAAGVDYDRRGIVVNDRCRTSAKNIYACGDVAGRFQFTHFAEHMAKVATSNALLHFPMSLDSKHITWCTYTEPEMAHVGASEEELRWKGVSYEVYKFPFTKIDRAITENEKIGWIKVYAKRLNGKIYGANILGSNAGEMIGEYALAMRNGVTLRQMADTIHPYPTYVLGNRRAADQWYVRKQSRAFVWLLQKIFRYKGQLPDTSDPERIV
jgi:pyruvate/2-oxoglutarate dehydrogenase complex dihydrolipoamide dehydrogenase (E3) component